MILVFDLDDTLYEEHTYVLSGLKAVAGFLAPQVHLAPDVLHKRLVNVLDKNGRGKVFDLVLTDLGIYSKKNVQACVSVYRMHRPLISLSKSGLDCLQRFHSYKKYLVTDGNKLVQQKKIEALKLAPYFEKMYRTYQYGVRYSKPSTYCFDLILKREKVKPADVVYIGDNPHKDFVNLKQAGYKTIRVRQGMFKNVTLSSRFEAEYNIASLDELTITFLKNKFADENS